MQARVRAQTHQVWRDSFVARWNGDGQAASGRGTAPLCVTADTSRRAFAAASTLNPRTDK